MRLINRSTLVEFLVQLDTLFARPGRLYLIGEATELLEGWRDWMEKIEFTAEVSIEDRQAFEETVRNVRSQLDVEVLNESPADIIPLPMAYEQRARPVGPYSAEAPDNLQIYHFDPYSVAFRFMARGDEQDYQLVLNLLQHEWLTLERMDAMLSELLPKFTFETIQQDPAEFRRKYKGLLQMWRAKQPGATY